ncbi:Imm50 family immunity protein [Pseudescherichia vulneris]
MKPWTDYLIDSKKIDSIYHVDKPSLDEIDVHELIFHRDGPKISIIFNLKEYPSKPPQKWAVQKFNVVQIKLSLIDIECVDMSGWVDTTYTAYVNIHKIDGLIHFNLNGTNLKLSLRAMFMDVESITAYMKN